MAVFIFICDWPFLVFLFGCLLCVLPFMFTCSCFLSFTFICVCFHRPAIHIFALPVIYFLLSILFYSFFCSFLSVCSVLFATWSTLISIYKIDIVIDECCSVRHWPAFNWLWLPVNCFLFFLFLLIIYRYFCITRSLVDLFFFFSLSIYLLSFYLSICLCFCIWSYFIYLYSYCWMLFCPALAGFYILKWLPDLNFRTTRYLFFILFISFSIFLSMSILFLCLCSLCLLF